MIPVLLWFLTFLFISRVLGQLLVRFYPVSFLPPFRDWFSGLLSYPFLLGAQILIIILMIKISMDVTRKRGYFAENRKWFRSFALYFGIIYLLAMIARYFWFGISIMVVFHWVLASFVILFAIYHRRKKHYPPLKK